MVSRVRNNAVAYYPCKEKTKKTKLGRPKVYGKKLKLKTLFDNRNSMVKAIGPIYGERDTEILYRTMELLWKPVDIVIRFIFVIHPHRDKIILLSTDLNIGGIDIIRLYALR